MSTDIDMVPDRQLIRAAHGSQGVKALIKAYSATVKAQHEALTAADRAYRWGTANADPIRVKESERADTVAYEAERALHILWRSMGYQDCSTFLIGRAIEWSF